MVGNIIVGQSGGPTAVINSSLAGVVRTALDLGAQHIYGMRYGVQGLLDRKIVELTDMVRSNLDIELLKRTPSSYLGSCRYKLPDCDKNPEVYEKIFEILKEYDIKAFFYIGGNDSMDTIDKLSKYAAKINSEIRFMGIPKTIDNDLAVTDHTPGFGSAAKYISSVCKEVIRDSLVYDIDSVTILEIMGRNAGWLTAAAALAKSEDCEGVDLIYLPEVDFDLNDFINRVKELVAQKKSIVIAVSEGIHTSDGKYVFELEKEVLSVDAFGHKTMSGTAKFLANCINAQLGIKARAIELSTLQRCASHLSSRVDVTEAYQVGGYGVKCAFEGETGKMVILKRVSSDPYICTTDVYDISQIANLEKKVPVEWITEDKCHVTDEALNYIRPLIQAELTPIMIAGQPRHITVELC